MQEPFEVWNGIYMVGDADLSHPYDCSVYLIALGDLVLIDAGAGLSFDRLVSNIEKLGFDPKKLRSVLATHAHIDHIGSLHEFRRAFGAEVIAHELDANAIEGGASVAAEAYRVSYTPCLVDRRLQGVGETLEFGGFDLKVIHVPGHTPGGVAAYVDVAGKRVLFGQDVHGPYYRFFGADPEQAKLSLQKLVDLRADILCEGHFGIYQPADEVERYIRGYMESL
jgi:glyoxylase-like metal-dependent hydrolase (beta-lactamase superfamily II)